MEVDRLLKKYIKNIPIILILIIFMFSTNIVLSQKEPDESAEIIAYINDADVEIPSIEISNWTKINITVVDAYGINWSKLQATPYLKFLTTYVWPIIHQKWKPLLGYSSLRFKSEIIEGNPKGWYTKISPTTISKAEPKKRYNLTLEIKTDDLLVDYAVIIGINSTRLNIYGEYSGSSDIIIPVKASPLKNIKMVTSKTKIETTPLSYVHFNLSLKNYGYYEEIYKLEIETENDLAVSASKQIFVLNPGDTEDIKIEVLTPEKIIDIGTASRIKIYATSSESNTPVLVGTLIIYTKGVFIPPFYLFIFFVLTLIILITYLLFIKIRKQI